MAFHSPENEYAGSLPSPAPPPPCLPTTGFRNDGSMASHLL
ncbi:hypothetical protein [Pelagicoccus enzymogenes]|nr:hypothetical protein [Pelagicoccus enzymogenes]